MTTTMLKRELKNRRVEFARSASEKQLRELLTKHKDVAPVVDVPEKGEKLNQARIRENELRERWDPDLVCRGSSRASLARD